MVFAASICFHYKDAGVFTEQHYAALVEAIDISAATVIIRDVAEQLHRVRQPGAIRATINITNHILGEVYDPTKHVVFSEAVSVVV